MNFTKIFKQAIHPMPWLTLLLAIFLSGCFETNFNFKTIVHSDGSISRETRIEGQGGNFFKAPAGPGWESKQWTSEQKQTLITDTIYHIEGHGRFQPGQVISPDFQFDVESVSAKWDAEQKQRLESMGIKEPYQDSYFARNEIELQEIKGWFTQTFYYREVLNTKGIIDSMLFEIKEEIKEQNQKRGSKQFTEDELTELARLRLEDEYLVNFHIQSEVSMPGRIISSNAQRMEGNKAYWTFSVKDFSDKYSVYTLEVASQSLRLPIFVILLGALLFAISIIAIVVLGIYARKRNGGSHPVEKNKTRSKR